MMRFERTRKQNVEGVVYVEYAEKTGKDFFSIIVTDDGIRITGLSPPFRTHAELQPLAKVMGEAVNDHAILALEAGKKGMINTPCEPDQHEFALDAQMKKRLGEMAAAK